MAKTTAERLADLERRIASETGKLDAWWAAQHKWNEEMHETAHETASSLQSHLVRCEETHKAATLRADRVEAQICTIAAASKGHDRDRAFSRGAYAVIAALVIIVPVLIQLATFVLQK